MRESLSLTLIASVTLLGMFMLFEAPLMQAVTVEDQVVINQTVTAGISITSPSDITMTALSMNQDTATGAATWNVKTNNQTGYTLSVNASTTNAAALCDDDPNPDECFTDYIEVSAGVPETWTVSNAYEFGFSAYGTHVNTSLYGTDTDCINGADVPSAALKYQGYEGLNLIEIASSTAETAMAGINTTLCVAVEQDAVYAPSGFYQATTTATAVTN